jgi:hypothetical protein
VEETKKGTAQVPGEDSAENKPGLKASLWNFEVGNATITASAGSNISIE